MVKDKVIIISGEISAAAENIDEGGFRKIVDAILQAGKVFISGAGRSGDIMKCMAKRLMHAGIKSYVVGETVTPPAVANDLIIIGSGSGETESLLIIAEKAKRLGASVALITTNPDSTIGKKADIVAVIQASTPKSKSETKLVSVQPMANLFEQLLFITTDAVSMQVAEEKGMDYEAMFKRHANLE